MQPEFLAVLRQVFTLLFVLFLVPLTSHGGTPDSSPRLETIRLQLKWRHQFQFAGYYAAVEQGYFREAGLNVELLEGQPNIDAAAQLLSGQAEYAVMSPAVLLERQKGRPLVALAAIFQHSASVLLTRKDMGIETPEAILGKRIMLNPEQDPETSAMLITAGVPLGSVTVMPHSGSLDDLLAGKVDAQVSYLTNEPYLMRQRGVEAHLLEPARYGIDFYGDCLVAHEHEVREHPERTEAFLRAVQRGWLYALEHPQEIAQLILA